MAEVTLRNISATTLMALGDAALKVGDIGIAKGLYGFAVQHAPQSPRARARLGLTLRPTPRAPQLLDAITALEQITPHVFVGEGIATWLKQPAFMLDEKFLALAAEHQELAVGGITNWHWNLQTLVWAAEQVRDLPGDFVELGVFRGHISLFLAQYLDFATWPKRWWLFDTFDGIPKDQLDAGWTDVNEAAYRSGVYSFEEVRDRFASFGNFEVTQGRVPDVFETACPEQIAFMHIDMNSAAAEIGALEALYDRITPGGVIVFDDFGWLASQAQFEAEQTWFRSRGLTIFPLPTGQGLFVKPPVAPAPK